MPWWAWWAGAGALLGAMPAAGQGGAGWPAAALEAFVPALRACLAAEAATAYAIDALPQAGGAVLVLLGRGDGGALACRVAADGAVQEREALAAAPPPDPAAPAFFLERRCVDARRVDAADGSVLGWLAYPAC